MLKDNSIDPEMGTVPTPTAKKAHKFILDDPVTVHESQNRHNWHSHNSPLFKEEPKENTPRSSHKIVTPLRRPTSSFLVASLESLFSDSKEVTEQIAKITEAVNSKTNSTYKKINTGKFLKLSSSLSSFSALDSLTDPTLLQSHVQKSLDSSVFGLESPYRRVSTTSSVLKTTTVFNASMSAKTTNNSTNSSLYNTPIRCKQSRSYDFSELSSQRSKQHRSSMIILDDEDLLSSFGGANGPLSDLSYFKDNEESVDVITPDHLGGIGTMTEASSSNLTDSSIFDCSSEEFDVQLDISPMKLTSSSTIKRQNNFSTQKRTLTLPSTMEYQDGSKPLYSYASLIAQAIIASPRKRIALSNIYLWIMETYPYYRSQTCGWQVIFLQKFIIYNLFLFYFILIISITILEFYKTQFVLK